MLSSVTKKKGKANKKPHLKLKHNLNIVFYFIKVIVEDFSEHIWMTCQRGNVARSM